MGCCCQLTTEQDLVFKRSSEGTLRLVGRLLDLTAYTAHRPNAATLKTTHF